MQPLPLLHAAIPLTFRRELKYGKIALNAKEKVDS
jgi:hypothetical protein